MEPQAAARILHVDDGEVVSDRPERSVRIICDHPLADATFSRYAARERGTRPHVHLRHADAFYVVEGELTLRLGPDGAAVRAPAGTFALVPPGVIHSFDNDAAATTRWLNVHAPSGGFAAYLRGDPSGFDDAGPPADGGRDPVDVLVATAAASTPATADGVTRTTLVSDPHLVATEVALAPGATIAPHRHGDGLDAMLVLVGAVVLASDDGEREAGPGTWLAATPATLHGIRNASGAPARIVTVRAPGDG